MSGTLAVGGEGGGTDLPAVFGEIVRPGLFVEVDHLREGLPVLPLGGFERRAGVGEGAVVPGNICLEGVQRHRLVIRRGKFEAGDRVHGHGERFHKGARLVRVGGEGVDESHGDVGGDGRANVPGKAQRQPLQGGRSHVALRADVGVGGKEYATCAVSGEGGVVRFIRERLFVAEEADICPVHRREGFQRGAECRRVVAVLCLGDVGGVFGEHGVKERVAQGLPALLRVEKVQPGAVGGCGKRCKA